MALRLQEYNLIFEHRKGKDNQLPDALSRVPLEDKMIIQQDPIFITLLNGITTKESFVDEQKNDPEFGSLYNFIQNSDNGVNDDNDKLASLSNDYAIIDKILFYTKHASNSGEYRPVIPQSLRVSLLAEVHDVPMAAHLGIKKTYERASKVAFWPGLRLAAKHFVQSCEVCQRTKYRNQNPAGKLIHREVNHIFERVGIDLMGPYPLSRSLKCRYILVMVDYFSKWVELIPLKSATAEAIAQALVDQVFCRYGAPGSVVSDNGPQFLSQTFRELCRQMDIKHILTTPYHPQSNLTERFNRNISRMIAAYIGDYHDEWDKYLQPFAFSMRTMISSTTSVEPAELFLGRKIQTPLEAFFSLNKEDPNVERLQKICDQVKSEMKKNERIQKRNYDKYRRENNFKTGEYVLVQTHYQSSADHAFVAKFAPLFEGPHQIISIKDNSVILKKRDGSSIKAHVDQLRKFTFRNTNQIVNPKSNIDVKVSPRYTPPFPNEKRKNDNKEQPTSKRRPLTGRHMEAKVKDTPPRSTIPPKTYSRIPKPRGRPPKHRRQPEGPSQGQDHGLATPGPSTGPARTAKFPLPPPEVSRYNLRYGRDVPSQVRPPKFKRKRPFLPQETSKKIRIGAAAANRR